MYGIFVTQGVQKGRFLRYVINGRPLSLKYLSYLCENIQGNTKKSMKSAFLTNIELFGHNEFFGTSMVGTKLSDAFNITLLNL